MPLLFKFEGDCLSAGIGTLLSFFLRRMGIEAITTQTIGWLVACYPLVVPPHYFQTAEKTLGGGSYPLLSGLERRQKATKLQKNISDLTRGFSGDPTGDLRLILQNFGAELTGAAAFGITTSCMVPRLL